MYVVVTSTDSVQDATTTTTQQSQLTKAAPDNSEIQYIQLWFQLSLNTTARCPIQRQIIKL